MLIRGYPLDEMMGRVGFGDAIYLLLVGELPPAVREPDGVGHPRVVGRPRCDASLDVVARNVATTGAPLRAAVAAGVLGFGSYHGGDVEACMDMLEEGLALMRGGMSYRESARALVQGKIDAGQRVPGLGHRLHTVRIRAPPSCSRWRTSWTSRASTSG